LETLKAMLRQLGEGAEINQVIEKQAAPMAALEKEFAVYARQVAARMAPGLDFERLDLKPGLTASSGAGPTNFWMLSRQAKDLVQARKWAEAKPVLETLLRLYPGGTGLESGAALLAQAHRALGETNAERQVLAQWAARDSTAVEAYARLMELGAADPPSLAQNARRYLAVNPLVALPYRYLAEASEARGDLAAAIAAQRALLQLDPANPAEVHLNLARLLHRAGDPAARRQVLQALEEAPRSGAALRLLLQIDRESPSPKTSASLTPP
jgi:tetratricopeptide (TPR) repeat protein